MEAGKFPASTILSIQYNHRGKYGSGVLLAQMLHKGGHSGYCRVCLVEAFHDVQVPFLHHFCSSGAPEECHLRGIHICDGAL